MYPGELEPPRQSRDGGYFELLTPLISSQLQAGSGGLHGTCSSFSVSLPMLSLGLCSATVVPGLCMVTGERQGTHTALQAAEPWGSQFHIAGLWENLVRALPSCLTSVIKRSVSPKLPVRPGGLC